MKFNIELLNKNRPWQDGKTYFSEEALRSVVEDKGDTQIPILWKFDPKKVVGFGIISLNGENSVIIKGNLIKSALITKIPRCNMKHLGLQVRGKIISCKEEENKRIIEEFELMAVGLVKMGGTG